MQLTLKRNTTAVILVRKLDCSVSHHREETVYVNVRSLNDNLVINSNDFHSAGFLMSLDVGKKHTYRIMFVIFKCSQSHTLPIEALCFSSLSQSKV